MSLLSSGSGRCRFRPSAAGIVTARPARAMVLFFPAVLLILAVLLGFTACGETDADFRLFAYPNPFDPDLAASARFVLVWQNEGATVTNLLRFGLFTQAGHRVLFRERTVTVPNGAQRFEYDWDGNNDEGKRVSPGTYLLQASTSGNGTSLASGQAWFKIVVR